MPRKAGKRQSERQKTVKSKLTNEMAELVAEQAMDQSPLNSGDGIY